MNARPTRTAVAAVLALLVAGSAAPLTAQAHGGDDGDRGYRHSERYNDDDGGWRHDRGRHRGWYKHPRYYAAPRYYYYPDTVIYTPAPQMYYYPAEPVYSYPQEYGSVGIHLDYNLLY